MLLCDLVQAYLDSEEKGKTFSVILTTISYKELSEMREILNREQNCCKDASSVYAIVSTSIVEEMLRKIRKDHELEIEVEELCQKLELMKPNGALVHERIQLLCILRGWFGLQSPREMEIESQIDRVRNFLKKSA